MITLERVVAAAVFRLLLSLFGGLFLLGGGGILLVLTRPRIFRDEKPAYGGVVVGVFELC